MDKRMSHLESKDKHVEIGGVKARKEISAFVKKRDRKSIELPGGIIVLDEEEFLRLKIKEYEKHLLELMLS